MNVILNCIKGLVLFILLQGGMLTAQMVQYGRVVEMNSGKKGLSGVSVKIPTAHDCQPTVSDANGTFRLVFGEHKVGDLVLGLSALKKGYEIVNTHIVREGCILTEKDSLRIVMAPEGAIKEAKMRYYYLLEEAYVRRYDTTMSYFKQCYAQNELSGQQLSYWESLVNEELKEAYHNLESDVDKLARINGDDLTVGDYQLYAGLLSGDVMPAMALIKADPKTNVLDAYIAFSGNYPMEDQAEYVAAGNFDLVDIPDSMVWDVMTLDNYSQQYESGVIANGLNYSKCCRYLAQLFLNAGDKVTAVSYLEKAMKVYELLNDMGNGDYNAPIQEIQNQLKDLE